VFGFGRSLGNAGYLDGYQDDAVRGYGLQENRYATSPPGINPGNQEVCLFAGANPGDVTVAVVLHPVKWGRESSTRVKQLSSSFFEGETFSIQLKSPAAYNYEEHAHAG
jgi:hypothetical protein